MTKYNTGSDVDHGWVSIMMNRHFIDFFTAQARQDATDFGNFEERQAALIDNYDLYVTVGAEGNMYMF